MTETTAPATKEEVVKQLTTRQLWGKLWFSTNRVDEVCGQDQATAQAWADTCWTELVERGEVRFRMFGGEHEADR